jgi:hypothetical protein
MQLLSRVNNDKNGLKHTIGAATHVVWDISPTCWRRALKNQNMAQRDENRVSKRAGATPFLVPELCPGSHLNRGIVANFCPEEQRAPSTTENRDVAVLHDAHRSAGLTTNIYNLAMATIPPSSPS